MPPGGNLPVVRPVASNATRRVHATTTAVMDPPVGTVYISSTDNSVGYDRSDRLIELCAKLGLKCLRMKPDMASGKFEGLLNTFLLGIKIWRRNTERRALFVEDDVVFPDKFVHELEESVNDLPPGWQVFHLCPGFLHDRSHKQNKSVAFDMKLEGPLAGNPRTSASGRVFLEWPRAQLPTCCTNDQGILPGGPVAALLRRDAMDLVDAGFREILASGANTPIDLALRDIAVSHDSSEFAAAQPQLCTEEGSLYYYYP